MWLTNGSHARLWLPLAKREVEGRLFQCFDFESPSSSARESQLRWNVPVTVVPQSLSWNTPSTKQPILEERWEDRRTPGPRVPWIRVCFLSEWQVICRICFQISFCLFSSRAPGLHLNTQRHHGVLNPLSHFSCIFSGQRVPLACDACCRGKEGRGEEV